MEELARSWLGDEPDVLQLEQARRAAAAQLDLERIDAARMTILARPWVREVKTSTGTRLKEASTWINIQEKIDRLVQKTKPTVRDVSRLERLIGESEAVTLTPVVCAVERDFGEIAKELLTLDRYERRARSRRRKALRELDKLIARVKRVGA